MLQKISGQKKRGAHSRAGQLSTPSLLLLGAAIALSAGWALQSKSDSSTVLAASVEDNALVTVVANNDGTANEHATTARTQYHTFNNIWE